MEKSSHSAWFQAGLMNRLIAAENITRITKHKVIEPAATEWYNPAIYAFESRIALKTCVEYRN